MKGDKYGYDSFESPAAVTAFRRLCLSSTHLKELLSFPLFMYAPLEKKGVRRFDLHLLAGVRLVEHKDNN